MGNIQIRQQSQGKRRTSIFYDRYSLEQAANSFRKSIAKKSHYQYTYSPIKYSKKLHTSHQQSLTQRKPITHRLEFNKIENKINNLVPNESQPDIQQNNFTLKSEESNVTEIKELQAITQRKASSFHLSGKIVSNSRRFYEERKAPENLSITLSKINREKIQQQNLQNKQIIRKVRNFNDFLNQIKRKLKDDKHENLLHSKYQIENSKLNQSFNSGNTPNQITKTSNLQKKKYSGEQNQQEKTFEKTKSTRKIQVALKLQNEKLQLQKYRKLVERELSKTHSIENISLSTKNSGQKVLTIQYESLLPHSQITKNYPRNTSNESSFVDQNSPSNSDFQTLEINPKESNQNEISKKLQGKQKQKQMIKKLKSQYERLRKDMNQLGRIIQKYETDLDEDESQKNDDRIFVKEEYAIASKLSPLKQNIQNSKNNNKDEKNSNAKIQKIEGLLQKICDLNREYQLTDRQIREAIDKSHSDLNLEESLRQNFSSSTPNTSH